MDDDEVFLKISPILFFEILPRKAVNDFERVSYTIGKVSSIKILIFGAKNVVALLAKESLVVYLADMLSSLTRIESYAISFKVKKRIWHKIRFNGLDIQSLMASREVVEDEYRLGFYKRPISVSFFWDCFPIMWSGNTATRS